MGRLQEKWFKIRYNLYAPFYDFFIDPIFNPLRKRSFFLADIPPKSSILIVGAGTGLDLKYLRDFKEITAIDVASRMLKSLKLKAKKLQMNVDIYNMDAKDLKFEDKTFDVVILHFIVAVIPRYEKCLLEVNRVLRDNGIVMVVDKFLPLSKPSFIRKLINPFAIIIASDLNLQSNDVIEKLQLSKLHEEKIGCLGLFRIIKLKKE